MTTLSVDASDPTPPFEQIRGQLALLIDSGELRVGQRLPTVRQLASDLQVAPGTVSRAFKKLEASGYVETRRAAGTRVRARLRSQAPRDVTDSADRLVKVARHHGMSDEQILNAVRASLARRGRAGQEE